MTLKHNCGGFDTELIYCVITPVAGCGYIRHCLLKVMVQKVMQSYGEGESEIKKRRVWGLQCY